MEVKQNGFAVVLRRGLCVAAILCVGSNPAFAQEGFRGGPPGFGPPGFGPPGGDFRSSDRGREDYRDRDRDKDRDRSDRDSSSSFRSSGSSSSPGGSSSGQASSVMTPSQVRVTIGLQQTYADVDSDRDGQVGLYEWRKAKRPLAQFTQFDLNKDGFLTPRELERAASMPMIASTPSPVPGATPTGAPTTMTPVASTATPTTPPPTFVSKLSEEDQTKADEAQAKSVFSLLDKDRDGKISAEEIARSTRIGPQFQQAGISFSDPMPAEQFVSNYVRIQKSKRT